MIVCNHILIFICTVSCQSPSDEVYNAGDIIKLSPSSDDFQVPKSADIVMVVEGKQCAQNTAEQLGGVVYEVESILTRKCMNDYKNKLAR